MNGLFCDCSDALMIRVDEILTTAGVTWLMTSLKEMGNRPLTVPETPDAAFAVKKTGDGAALCDATAKAAINPPPKDAATSVRIAVVRRN